MPVAFNSWCLRRPSKRLGGMFRRSSPGRRYPADAVTLGLEALELLLRQVTLVQTDVYAPFEAEARRRLIRRDEEDWPYVALALSMNCPIWTEDRDFFGSGVATWTTDRIEMYLSA
jgi:hypothetical protein